MKRHLSLARAVLVKDFWSLWPMVAVMVAIQALQVSVSEFGFNFSALLRPIMPAIAGFAAGIFTLFTLHQDAATDGRHDGLTRPVPIADLFAAKAALIWATIFLPSIIGTLMAGFIDGRSILESFLLATTVENSVTVAIVVLVAFIAIVTSTLLQAAGAIVGLFVLISVLDRYVVGHFSTGDFEAVLMLGSGWVVQKPLILLVPSVLAAVTWLQYRRRDTTRARVAFVVSLTCLICVPVAVSYDYVLSVQKLTEKDSTSADSLTVTFATECVPSIVINPQPATVADENNNGPIKISPAIFDEERRDLAGPNAVIFATPLLMSGEPEGWVVRFSYAHATFLNERNEVIREQRPAIYTPRLRPLEDRKTAIHFWMLSRDRYDEIKSQAARLRLDYSLALLRPHAHEIEVGTKRRYFPLLGYCGAVRKPSSDVEVECFKSGPQPAAVSIEWKGAPDSKEFVGDLDYTPAWLSFPEGERRKVTLKAPPDKNASSVVVTAYEVRSFTQRQVDVPSGLGNPVANCPLRTK